MQALKTALVAGTIAIASTMAFAQNSSVNDSSKTEHNLGTDKGAAKPSTVAPGDKAMKSPGADPALAKDADKTPHNAATDKGAAAPMAPDTKSGMKSPGASPSTTGAEISDKNKTGSRPGEDTASPADQSKTR